MQKDVFKDIGDSGSPQPLRFLGDTPEAREATIAAITDTIDRFYAVAKRTAVHRFIEFAGFMQEWLKMVHAADLEGADGLRGDLPVESHRVDYVCEKLECIYGPHFVEAVVRVYVERHFGGIVPNVPPPLLSPLPTDIGPRWSAILRNPRRWSAATRLAVREFERKLPAQYGDYREEDWCALMDRVEASLASCLHP